MTGKGVQLDRMVVIVVVVVVVVVIVVVVIVVVDVPQIEHRKKAMRRSGMILLQRITIPEGGSDI